MYMLMAVKKEYYLRGSDARERINPGEEQEAQNRRPMKRICRRTRIGTQEVTRVIGPAARYSQISAWLNDAEQALQQMSRELKSVQKSRPIASSRNRNVIIHGVPEEGKQRERAVSYHVVNLLRTVKIMKYVTIKRVICLGRWQGASDS